MNKIPTLDELRENFKSCPKTVNEYVIEGKKFVIHSHFIGEKNIDEIISRIAFERALKETISA